MNRIISIALIACLFQASSFAQDGSLDLSFDPGNGFNSITKAVAFQPDGKILVGGYFTEFDGTSVGGIARLNSDGSLDNSFNTGTGFTGQVFDIILQPNGKIIVSGGFSLYNGVSTQGIIRLNADGTVDQSFNVGQGLDLAGIIYEMVLQPDGKIVIGGYFSSFDGVERKSIARLNSDGSLDQNFYPNPSISFAGQVLALELQSDGNILVGGWFDEFETSQAANIVRLNSDGTVDASFDCGIGVDAYGIEDFAVQPDGRIIMTGQYGEFNGTESIMVSRLLSDGTLDNTFQMDTAINWYAGVSLQLQPDDKIILGGWLFTWPNGQDTAMNIVRLNVDGSIDQSFDPGSGVDAGATVWDIALQSDGKILLAGVISHVDGVPRNFIARLNNSSISSVGEYEEHSVSIYPNPATTNLTIESRSPLAQVWVRDVAGRVVLLALYPSTTSGYATIDVSSLPSGIYLVEVLTQSGQRSVQKMVVE